MEKLEGIILHYDNEKKYGFIRNKDKKDIFFHISEYRPNKSPVIGENIIFELSNDKQGRIYATNIQELSFVIQKNREKQLKIQKRQAYEAYQERQEQKHTMLSIICIISLLFLVGILILALFFNLLKWIIGWYFLISLISFFAYWHDKNKAENNEWRTPENTLHLIDVLGGWVGASFAHKLLDHKATKAEFRVVYYFTIVLNIIALVAYLLFFK